MDIVLRFGVAVLLLTLALAAGSVFGRWAEKQLRTRRGRAHSLAATLRTVIRLSAGAFGAVVALDQLGVNLGAILAGAGILGLAIGFGAQALVKDVISGFFLILDGAIEEGDQVQIGAMRGTVEEIGLRVTKLRGENDQLWYVQNGEIRTVGNFSRGSGERTGSPRSERRVVREQAAEDAAADAIAEAAVTNAFNR